MAESTSLTRYFGERKQMRLASGEADVLSARSFNAVMCGVLAYGLLVNALMVHYLAVPVAQWAAGISGWLLLVAYLVPTLAGCLIAAASRHPAVSFLGYNLVVLPIGIMLTLLLPSLPAAIVVKALLLTAMVTVTMLLLAIVRPEFFLGLGRTLLVALFVGLLAEVVATLLLGYRGALFDWLFVLLFSGYIGYDVAKSQAYPKTVDNAVDSALDIYLDLINLFLRILSLLSRRD